MENEYNRERLEDYKRDLEDCKKSYAQAIEEEKSATEWKFKQMAYLVEAFNKLEKLTKEMEGKQF